MVVGTVVENGVGREAAAATLRIDSFHGHGSDDGRERKIVWDVATGILYDRKRFVRLGLGVAELFFATEGQAQATEPEIVSARLLHPLGDGMICVCFGPFVERAVRRSSLWRVTE